MYAYRKVKSSCSKVKIYSSQAIIDFRQVAMNPCQVTINPAKFQWIAANLASTNSIHVRMNSSLVTIAKVVSLHLLTLAWLLIEVYG